MVLYSVIRINKFCDPQMAYLAENECTNDPVLNLTFDEINDFIEHAKTRMVISILLVGVVGTIDLYCFFHLRCFSGIDSAEEQQKKKVEQEAVENTDENYKNADNVEKTEQTETEKTDVSKPKPEGNEPEA